MKMFQGALTRSFERWAEVVEDLRRKEEVVGKILYKILFRALRGAFERWSDFAAEKADASPEQKPPGVAVVVRSGDALLFRGHAVFHAVDGFVEETDEDAFSTFSALDATRDGAWRERLLAPARSAPRAGWKPERLALLFRHEVDAAGSERPPARARKKTRTNERYTPGSG